VADPGAAAQPGPAPANPRFAGSVAQVGDPRPPRRSNVAVTARILRDGQPVPGAEVHAVAHFKTVDERWPSGSATQRTDQNGETTIVFGVGDATPGHQVNVDVIAGVDGEQLQLQTAFTPR
jgi:hypothetical protein